MAVLSPKYCLTCLAILFAFHVSAQSTILKQFNNGKIKCTYEKVNTNTTYELHVVYKNELVVYKEEKDSLVLHNNNEVLDFTSGLQKTIQSLADDKATLFIEKTTYTLFKYDKGMLGIFVSLSNPSGSIVASFNKQEAQSLLDWLKSIEFGKE
jgi:hypothetical protein